jgi:hypothetical protein
LLSEILAEEERLPVGLLDEVLEAKAYRIAYDMVERADTAEARKSLPKREFFALVDQIERDLVQEELKKG